MYPAQICLRPFPISRFQIRKNATLEDLETLIYKNKKAVLIRCSLIDIELKDDLIPVPYLATSKCSNIIGGVYDNGRILAADFIGQTTLTDLDYKILKRQYKFKIKLITVASARYGMLPEPLRECVLSYYQGKTELKNKPDDEEHTAEFYALLYNKMKNLLNAQYGMMAQDPVKVDIKYVNSRDDLFKEDESAEPELILKDHNKRAFLCYQWGCWVTSWARYHLQEGIDAAGIGFVYCDTDSIKYVGDIDLSHIDNEYKKLADKYNCYAVDPKGKKHYMGIFEDEPDMLGFKTLGAKKYAYREMDGTLHITIAGVNKKIGAIELERAGGLHAMRSGFKFIYGGGLEARYSDFPETTEFITEDGVPIRITRNVSLVENTKTLGITAEYRQLLEEIRHSSIDL